MIADRFHIMKLMNPVLDQVRRSEQSRWESEGKQVLKGGRYLLLRNRITVEQDEAASSRLEQLPCANQALHQVYLLKQELRLRWEQPSQVHAEAMLSRGCAPPASCSFAP